jgi:UDP:flavonoid glycosyltransferase YjiC (YdhE family)
MRILFVCLPATGHFLPLVPLARALRDAGHAVAFATGADFAPEVERAGFPALPAGMVGDEWGEEAGRAYATMTEQDPLARIAAFCLHVFAGPLARRLANDLPGVLGAWRADLVVHEDTALGAAVAAERAGLPHARMMILAAGPAHPLYARLDEAFGPLRAAHGLPPASADATLHRHLLLYPFPPGLLLPGRPVPATLRAIRPALPPPAADEVAPAWLGALGRGGRPVVYATLGTLFNGPKNDAIFAAYLAALRDEPVDVVLTVGADRDPAEFGPQPPHIRVVRFVPLALLLPRCDLVLSHGGSGTVVAALAGGLPQVIVPIFADQPENAARVAALGAGRVVSPDERTPAAIRAAVRAVLSDPAYRLGAERLRNEIRALPGPGYGVALLEQLVAARGSHQPPLAEIA